MENIIDDKLENVEHEIVAEPETDDEVVKDFHAAHKDFMDMFVLTSNALFPAFPTSSAAKMSQVTNSNQTSEEQIENIKKVAEDIAEAIKSEMANLLSFAMALNATANNTTTDRSKRSAETPMDSTQMVMRLLKHIKATNENQNIAIEKMMTAQEIAEKFGIEFNPDPEILSDLADAATDHAQEISNLLKDACDATQEIKFVPVKEQPMRNESYYTYVLHPEDIQESTVPPFEYCPDVISKHVHIDPHHHSCIETQIPPPPVHHHSAPVTPCPNFYDPFPYTSDICSPYADMSPAIFIIEDPEPEPELYGEEVEETISTKLFVERGEEPGSATVNQVTTYSVAEKSHFRTPQIERLPEQFQYSFFLM